MVIILGVTCGVVMFKVGCHASSAWPDWYYCILLPNGLHSIAFLIVSSTFLMMRKLITVSPSVMHPYTTQYTLTSTLPLPYHYQYPDHTKPNCHWALGMSITLMQLYAFLRPKLCIFLKCTVYYDYTFPGDDIG